MQEPSPMLFLDSIFFGYHTTAALMAAIELGLFTAIGEGADTAGTLAGRIGAAPRGAQTLADFLTMRGFLQKDGGHYRLTPDSAAFLDRRSPAYLGGVVDFLAARENLDVSLADPAATVRAGGAPGLAYLAPDHPIWVKFARAMVPLAAPSAEAIAAKVAAEPTPPRTVLDIAAGHGMFGITLAKAIPTAQVTAVDWGSVLTVAEENAAKMQIAARYRTLPGSAFEVDWGGGYDVILLPNILHHFDAETCAALLRRVRASLAPDGRVLAVEFVANPDRVSPPFPAMFAFIMLTHTPHGGVYTAAELEGMARAAGFRGIAAEPVPNAPQTLVEFLT